MAKVDWKDANATAVNVTSTYPRGRRQYTVVFAYTVDGRVYEGTLYSFKAYAEGDSVAVRYDSEDPQRTDIQQRQKRKLQIVYVVIVLYAIVVGTIVYWVRHS